VKLSIIIPTYNEENTITQLVQYVQAVNYPVPYEIVIVDDASHDRTYEKEALLKSQNRSETELPVIRIFRNPVNRGKGFSVRRGITEATGDFIVIQDADTEYDPQEIPKLLGPILRGEAEVVYGSRFLGNPHPQGMAFPSFAANKVLTQLTNLLFGLHLTDMETCYKVFKAERVKSLPLRANRFAFEPEVTAQIAKSGVTIKELPISYRGRSGKAGKKIKARDFFFAVGTLIWQRLTR
jgi:glycosyltransferase involved in cell wall biosynthesis